MNRAAPQARVRTRARESGFTLIELLVSLTILSVILGLLAGALRVLSKNWQANAERIETLDMVSRAADILRRDASGLQRIVAVSGRIPRYLFTGAEDHMAFVTLEPPYPSSAGPYFVSYVVSPNGPEADLIRSRAPYQKGMEAFPGATPANRVRLVEGAYRYHLAYADKSAGAGQWRNSWPYTDRLPDMIRLQIVDARRNAPVAPPLTVAIRADAELGCLAQKSKVCSAKSDGRLKAGGEPDGDGSNRKSKE
jgi:general secretion pathway protein J